MTMNPMTVRSTEDLRSQFPALERRQGGRPVAYFDGPGGTQVPGVVVEAVSDYLLRHNANTHWAFPTSEETDVLLGRARRALADFLNASPEEIAFGNNMTSLTFHLARALGRGMSPGDQVVVTEMDHHANVDPWRDMARERGLTLRTVRFDPKTFRHDPEDLARCLLNPRTKLLAIGAASNALGTITDVQAATAMAHDVGALVFIDAVHHAPHELVDVASIGCDFLACSAYKFYGPHVGVLYGRRDLIEGLDAPKLAPAPNGPPERLETGTQNHEGIVGAAAAVRFLASLASGDAPRRERLQATYDALHTRSLGLFRTLWEGLESIPGVTLHGPSPDSPRTPTVSFTVQGVLSREVARGLAALGVFVSHGDFYASTVVERLGETADGLVRAGCACYTTEEEVNRLIEGVRALSILA